MLDERHRDWVDRLPVAAHPRRHRVRQDQDRALRLPAHLRPTPRRRRRRRSTCSPSSSITATSNVTRGYYRVGEDRRRAAVDTVTAMSFDRHGNRIWRDAHALLDSEHARYAVGEVAVPYGLCTEPSNVQAGGGACPVRFRCAGCDHFRTDVSYLPDLHAYLDDLLRTRERLAAAIDGVDEWARADATPSQRGDHPDPAADHPHQRRPRPGSATTERAQIDDAVAVVRRHRAVSRSACPPSVPATPDRPRRRPPHDQHAPQPPTTNGAAHHGR